ELDLGEEAREARGGLLSFAENRLRGTARGAEERRLVAELALRRALITEHHMLELESLRFPDEMNLHPVGDVGARQVAAHDADRLLRDSALNLLEGGVIIEPLDLLLDLRPRTCDRHLAFKLGELRLAVR